MFDKIGKSWKQSLFVFNLDFYKKFYVISFNKAIKASIIFIKKFWVFPFLIFVLSLIILLFGFLSNFTTIQELLSFKSYFQKSPIFAIIISVLLIIILFFVGLFYMFLPLFITHSIYENKDFNYIDLFFKKILGLTFIIPFIFFVIWSSLFSLFKFSPFLLPLGTLFALLLYLIKQYTIFLFIDSRKNQTIKSFIGALKIFIYNFPAYLFLIGSLFLLNIPLIMASLLIIGIVSLIFTTKILLLMLIPFLLLACLANIFYFLNISFLYNFYQITKNKNINLLRDL